MGQHLQDLGINPEGMNLVEMARLASQLGTNGQAQAVGTELPEPEVATFGDPTVTSPLPSGSHEEQFELAVRVLDATEDQLVEIVNQYRLPIPEVNRSYSSIRDISQALYEHDYLDRAYVDLLAVPEIVSLSRDRYKRAVQGLGDAYGVQGSSQARILAQLYVNGVLIPDQRLRSNRAPWVASLPLDLTAALSGLVPRPLSRAEFGQPSLEQPYGTIDLRLEGEYIPVSSDVVSRDSLAELRLPESRNLQASDVEQLLAYSEPQSTPSPDNPYNLIPMEGLMAVASERGIRLSGGLAAVRRQLLDYDRRYPQDYRSALAASRELGRIPTTAQLLTQAAYGGIDLRPVPLQFFSRTGLSDYLTIRLYLKGSIDRGMEVEGALESTLVEYPAIAYRGLLDAATPELWDDILFMTHEQLEQAILTRQVEPVPEELKERYAVLVALPRDVQDLLLTVELDPGLGATPLHRRTRAPFRPIDRYTIAWGQGQRKEVIEGLGMVIPPGVDLNSYVLTNLPHYQEVADYRVAGQSPPELHLNIVELDQRLQSNRAPWSRRPLDQGVYRTFTHLPRDYAWQMLRPYGDEQLMALFGLYPPYDDRRDLIQRLLDLRTQPGFFIPYIRRCQNRETVLGTPIKDLRFIVAFGTLYDYQCYELEELTGAFDFYEGAFSFRHPDFRATFTRDQIRDLETLLERYPEVEGRAQLLEKIQIGLRLLTTASAYDREVLGQFQSFSRAERAMIERMLQLIFEAGMYMRRWQGPGHPYPLRKEATMSPDDPTARVSRVLGEIRDLLNRSSPVVADFIRSLHQVQLFRGRVERSTEPFSEIYDEVFGCRACIRVASTYFIGTAYHYLQLLFDETIPGFDPEILDPIAYSPEELRAMRT